MARVKLYSRRTVMVVIMILIMMNTVMILVMMKEQQQSDENKPYMKECIISILLQKNDLFNGQIKYYLKIYIFDFSLYFP